MANAGKRRPKASKGHKLPEPVPNGFEVYDTTKRFWKFGKVIGHGGFGVVYEASDAKTPEYNFVIKVEHHGNGPLFTELHCYHAIGKPEEINEWIRRKKLQFLGISPCFGSGSFELNDEKYRFMVLEKYGKDLQFFLNQNGNVLHPKTVFTIGINLLNTLEYIHGKDYIHGDIKAANLLCGSKKKSENYVYLLDFGLSGRFMTKDGIHKKSEPDPRRQHNGTLEFTSRDAHNGVYSRRSDLEILGYNILFWLNGTLPWQNISDPVKVQKQKCRYMDNIPMFMQTLFDSNLYSEVFEYLNYVQKLGFEQKPNYEYCKKLMSVALKNTGHKLDGILILHLEEKKETTTTTASAQERSSEKENKVAKKRSQVKRRQNPIDIPPDMVLTPAMLSVLNKRQNSRSDK